MALRPLLAVALALLLAGCASRPSAPTTAPSTTATMPPGPAPAPAYAAPAAFQQVDLAWSAAASGCVFGSDPGAPATAAFDQLYAPQAKGTLYDAARVDHATWGASYNATFQFSAGGTVAVLLFWNQTVGAGGNVVGSSVGSGGAAQTQQVLEGQVPEGADLVTASGCSGPLATAHYAAGTT